MKIDFEKYFLNHILSRGQWYQIADKVSDVTFKRGKISAIVHGTEDYNVTINIKDNIKYDGGTCNCPYYHSDGPCKHMAAVLFYVNEKIKKDIFDNVDLDDIFDEIGFEDIKYYLYNLLMNNDELLEDFFKEFEDYFPKVII